MVLSIGTPNSDTNVNLFLQPTNGADQIYGRGRNDNLSGLGGNDVMYGDRKPPFFPPFPLEIAGDDTLRGDSGNDLIYGDPGNDLLYGGTGVDTLYGGVGNDRLYGETENDALYGESGNDTMLGGAGNDFLNGGTENDLLYGESGNDNLFGDVGNDTLYGGSDNDILRGANGFDGLYGQSGNDYISGGNDNDSAYGGTGNDRLLGDSGNDYLVGVETASFTPGRGEIDQLTGGTGFDRFALGNSARNFYDDGLIFNEGRSDFALITDFTNGQDTIQLKGGVNYRLSNVAVAVPAGFQAPPGSTISAGSIVTGVGVFVDNPGFLRDEMIGVVQGAPIAALNVINRPAGGITTIV
ncbi:MAG: hypothetical protein Kow00121_16450 [Elainellaceae cyanobacterium]